MPRVAPLVRFISLAVVCFVLALGAVAQDPPLAEKPERRPWELRESYTFRGNNVVVYFFNDNGQVYVATEDERVMLGEASFVIELGDGTRLTSTDFEKARSERIAFESPVGPGTHFATTFLPRDGMTVTFRVATFAQRSNIVLELEVANSGDEPVTIAAIRPLVTGPQGMRRLTPETTYATRPLVLQGGVPLYGQADYALMGLFRDPSAAMTLALGLLPLGVAHSGVQFAEHEGIWHGEVFSEFAPALRLDPGDRLMADPIWLSFVSNDLDSIGTYFAYAVKVLPDAPTEDKTRKAWVSAPVDDGPGALLQAARAWDGAGVGAALVPGGWERVPGSTQGGGEWPSNISEMAGRISGAGMTAGITVDPWAVDGGRGDWGVDAPGGVSWANPMVEAGRAAARSRLNDLRRAGFSFAACAPTAMPDEALERFNITRVQADRAGLRLAAEVWGAENVVPAPQGGTGPDAETWAGLARVGRWFDEYDVPMGPVRLLLDESSEVPAPVLADIDAWGSPIEFSGRPPRSTRDALGGIAGN